MTTEGIDGIVPALRGFMDPQAETGRPLFPGAVVLVVRDGVTVLHEALGHAVRYAGADGGELPAAEQVAMAPDTIFDVASISKLFTTIAVLREVEAGRLDLDATVATYLPEFAVHGKRVITVRQLLRHTSGLPALLPLWRDWPDKPARIAAALDVEPSGPPEGTYLYSDMNMITLGVLAERVSGRRLDELVRAGITEPLGLADTGYNPAEGVRDRIAATECERVPDRGVIRGQVHDENAWSLGGVAGHAGIFSTARDLATLAQAILDGGGSGAGRILESSSVASMLSDANLAFPGHAHGLGFELDQPWYMGGLASPRTAGHTGFTGTSLVLEPRSRTVVILLTNRVHPSREWGSVNPARQRVGDLVAHALASASV